MRLLLAFLIIPFTSFCQTDAHQVPKEILVGGIHKAKLYYSVSGTDTNYILKYLPKTERENFYEPIYFSSQNGTLDNFYVIMKSFFTADHRKDKEYKVAFMLGNTHIVASNQKNMGGNQVRFWTTKGAIYLDERQVDKLFGK